MTKLEKDLAQHYDEAYYRRDIRAGIKLIGEVAGMVSIASLLASALFVWLPGIGIPITTIAAFRIIGGVATAYSDMDAEERRNVRAVVSWVNGGIRLLD